jgi:hypothetical protein
LRKPARRLFAFRAGIPTAVDMAAQAYQRDGSLSGLAIGLASTRGWAALNRQA